MGSTSLHKPETIDIKVKREIVWQNAIGFFVLHLVGLYGFCVSIFSAKFLTWVYGFHIFIICGGGITVGAHRLYTHRSYNATFGLRCFLMTAFTLAGENCMYIWARDHRQHHKYSDTDADPHNSSRGFFFSHAGWLMVRKHPEVITKGKTIDLSDLQADPIVMFQKKYYFLLYAAISAISVMLPCLLWGESLRVSILGVYAFRSVLVYNCSWLVNSAAHLYGTRPYNNKLQPVESNFVSAVTFGEGWHNFHHCFPSDFRASEYGQKHDLATKSIEFMKKIGWAYDLRETPQHVVNNWVKKFGDGSHLLSWEEEDIADNI